MAEKTDGKSLSDNLQIIYPFSIQLGENHVFVGRQNVSLMPSHRAGQKSSLLQQRNRGVDLL